MSSHQSNYEPRLIDKHASTNLRTFRHPYCPGWLIVLSNSGIPLATSDTGILKVAFSQPSLFFNIVTTIWHTFEGIKCTLWLVQERNLKTDNTGPTSVWFTLYLFLIRCLYLSSEERPDTITT